MTYLRPLNGVTQEHYFPANQLGIGAGDLGPVVLPSMANLILFLFCQTHPQFYKEAGQPGRDSSRLYSLQYFYEGCEDFLYAGEERL